jgi:hypothetical protein
MTNAERLARDIEVRRRMAGTIRARLAMTPDIYFELDAEHKLKLRLFRRADLEAILDELTTEGADR